MPGIPIILSTAMWLTLTQPTGRNGQCEQLEFPVRWKFLASIISQFSPAYMCWNPLLGPAMLGAMGDTKMSKTKTAFLPFKEFMFFYVPFFGSSSCHQLHVAKFKSQERVHNEKQYSFSSYPCSLSFPWRQICLSVF